MIYFLRLLLLEVNLFEYKSIEILEYAACLKCSPDPILREQKIKEILADLELSQVENVKFGGGGTDKVLSRGEKKRLSIAVELITNPALVFMDEPTTSMDTYTAERIIEIINKLKDKGRTIIATIHQPNTKMFRSFDRLMLLSYGYVIYFVNNINIHNCYNREKQKKQNHILTK